MPKISPDIEAKKAVTVDLYQIRCDFDDSQRQQAATVRELLENLMAYSNALAKANARIAELEAAQAAAPQAPAEATGDGVKHDGGESQPGGT